MLKWLEIIVRTIVSTLCTQRSLAIENPVLRQQLAVLKHRHPRPRLTDTDRFFWIVLSRIWVDWRESLHIVQPETVVRLPRRGKRFWQIMPKTPLRWISSQFQLLPSGFSLSCSF